MVRPTTIATPLSFENTREQASAGALEAIGAPSSRPEPSRAIESLRFIERISDCLASAPTGGTELIEDLSPSGGATPQDLSRRALLSVNVSYSLFIIPKLSKRDSDGEIPESACV